MFIAGITIMALAFIQNISFSLVSRSRNRDNMKYHIIASGFSNTIWFMTFKQLIMTDMSYYVLPFYMIGTIAGSVFGVKISMRIERWLGATSDGHLKSNDK
jgi:predicted neutral ceramidase superfamily lipid hydrolase